MVGNRKDRDRGRRGHSGRGRSIKGGGLVKDDISRYTDSPNNRVVTAISLMLKTVTKEDTRGRLSSELGLLPGREQDKAATTKDTKMVIARRGAMETLTRAMTVKK